MAQQEWINHQWGRVYKTRDKAEKVAAGLRKEGWETKIKSFSYRKGVIAGKMVTGYYILKRR